MQTEQFNDLGILLSDCYVSAIDTWRREYSQQARTTEVFAHELRRVNLFLTAYPGGFFQVTVEIAARKVWQSEKYFWKVQLVGGTYHLH